MSWYLLPLVIGATLVVQSGLNDTIQQKHGLIYAMFTNNLIFISLSVFLLWLNFNSGVGNIESLKVSRPSSIHWWYIFPGIMGAVIVGGSALSLEKLGAGKTMILLVSAQIIVGIAWDYLVKSRPINLYKVVGSFLIIAGALLSVKE